MSSHLQQKLLPPPVVKGKRRTGLCKDHVAGFDGAFEIPEQDEYLGCLPALTPDAEEVVTDLGEMGYDREETRRGPGADGVHDLVPEIGLLGKK